MPWRPMLPTDLPAVLRIAAAVHPGYPEGAAVFAERLALFPAGAWLLAEGGVALGYALAHPWPAGQAVPLDTLLGALPASGERLLYLHDLALLPAARGRGQGAAAVALLRGVAVRAGLAGLGLVALPGTARFWRAQGFHPAPASGLDAGYGEGAGYLRGLA